MEKFLLRSAVQKVTLAACPLWTLRVVCLVRHHSIYDFVDIDVVFERNLILNAILRHDLNVVFLLILWKQESKPASANVFPAILRI